MSAADDYAPTLREVLATLAAADPRRRRFGAAQHGYELAAPLEVACVDALERAHGIALPADYRTHITTLGDGGAGPYLGLLPFDHPIQHALLRGPSLLPAQVPTMPFRLSPWRGCVALAHLGCGYVALLVVDGPAHGTVWLDARSIGLGVVPLADSFAAFYLDWLLRTARGDSPQPIVPADVCALPAALSGYLAHCEQASGVAPGGLDGAALRAAFADIPAGGIALAATGDDPLFVVGTPLQPCVRCAQLIVTLGADGLAADVLAPGVAALR